MTESGLKYNGKRKFHDNSSVGEAGNAACRGIRLLATSTFKIIYCRLHLKRTAITK